MSMIKLGGDPPQYITLSDVKECISLYGKWRVKLSVPRILTYSVFADDTLWLTEEQVAPLLMCLKALYP